MPKVLFVATVVRTHINVFHIPYLKYFKKLGYEVHVCAKNDYEIKDDCKIKYCDQYYDINFDRFPFSYINVSAYKQLKNIIEKNKYELIHCHTPVGGAITRLAANKCRKEGTKVLYTAHGFHFLKGGSWLNWILYYPVEKYLSRFADGIITINNEDYKRCKKFHAKNCYYVNGVGIDLTKFSTCNDNKLAIRKGLGIPEDCFLMLSVGELTKNKNHTQVIKTLLQIQNKNIYYAICGSGAMEKEIKNIIKKHNLGERVILLGFRKDVPEIFKVSDLFVFPSKREGLPVALMESMASGLPAIVNDCRGNRDLIDNDYNGYVIDVDDINAFRQKIKFLYENLDLRMEFANRSREKIKEYSLDRVLPNMSKIYSEHINKKAK